MNILYLVLDFGFWMRFRIYYWFNALFGSITTIIMTFYELFILTLQLSLFILLLFIVFRFSFLISNVWFYYFFSFVIYLIFLIFLAIIALCSSLSLYIWSIIFDFIINIINQPFYFPIIHSFGLSILFVLSIAAIYELFILFLLYNRNYSINNLVKS